MKKILSLCLVLCLAAIALIGGTLAYFTDTEYVGNTMVSGKIDIEQSEWKRDGVNPDLIAYTDRDLIPAVVYDQNGKLAADAWKTWVNGTATYSVPNSTETFQMPDTQRIRNVVDKIVTVQNTGANNAYVRTIFVMHCDSATSKALDAVTYQYDETFKDGTGGTYIEQPFTLGGKACRVVVFTYKDALVSQEVSRPSLLALWMNPAYNAQDFTQIDVLAYSQAVQAEGFDDPDTALNAAFGDINQANLENWFNLVTP